ncbi:DNA-directed DNA polymerase [Methylocystaceae bacterium]|nr:DNA-directed DNA polymerase [Methylocystaceae bacterium]
MLSSPNAFVHLHLHTAFSLREGALTLSKLIDLAVHDSQPALAITDTNNLFAALEFAEKAAKYGIQPITGIQLSVDFADGDTGSAMMRERSFGNVVLLAKTEDGYRNLMRIASRAYLDPEQGDLPHVSLSTLKMDAQNLIALSGGPDGGIDRAFASGNAELATRRVKTLETIFQDKFYIELQRHNLQQEREIEPLLLDLAYRRGLPLVAANETYFASVNDFEAHDALLCIADGTLTGVSDRRRVSQEHRFKTQAEMVQIFSDLPEATINTIEIARRVSFRPQTRKPIMPRFIQENKPDNALDEIEAQELRRQSHDGLMQRLALHGPAPGHSSEEYLNRLNFELDVIEKMRFPGYFLIVSDFIKFAKSQNIPVGPGRGSGAGSLVAYALTITDLDPVRFGLFFERFLNPERNSMPDFDIDFCQIRRNEVIDYVRTRYGEDRVAQIITFGSFLARGVLRSVGRVLEMPLGHVDKLAKLVPQNPAKPITLAEALATEQKLREEVEKDEKVARLFKIAGALEGLYSNASTHAAGIVIGDRPLHEVTPLYRDSKSDMPATQFNMKWVEPAGLIKFDFLGLKTLTVLAMASNLVRRRSGEFKLENIALDDPETYAMLGRGETIGVFQLESAGMRKALVEMHADRFEDIIALVALYRPGPMANIPTYCAVKLGDEEPDYIHPAIEPILKETFGVIIYQEQVMQIAQVLSGYSLGEADNLRRAMGKKIKSEMSAQRDRFVTGAVERGLTKNKANEIFDLLAKFADYGFNKSHAAAYALIAYQTAWFKAHYPAEFLAASMTFDKNQTDKLAEFRDEALRIGITVDPPSICHSGVDFDVAIDEDDKLTIRYALSAIKGVGEGQADSLVRSRGTLPYKDLADFANRINPREVNKKVLDNLAACGAFDELLENRACVFASIETILAAANRHTDDRKAGQNALFGKDEAETLALAKVPPWPIAETLKREYEAAGFFLSGHPLDAYESLMSKLRVSRWGKFTADVKKGATAGRLAAVVLDRAERRTKSGSKMGIVQLSDVSGQYEAILFQEGLNQFRDKLEKGAAVLLTLSASIDGDDVRARIISVESLEIAAARAQKGIRIILNNAAPILDIKNKLTKKGEREVSILFKREKSPEEIEIRLPGGYSVNPETAHALRAVPGVLEVEYL